MPEIVVSEDVLGGKPRVEDTRVSAEQIYEMHKAKGMKPAEIAEVLPSVDLEGVNAAIEYMG